MQGQVSEAANRTARFPRGRFVKRLILLGMERWLIHRGNVLWTLVASGIELSVVLLFFSAIYVPDSNLHDIWPWGRQLWLIGLGNLINAVYRFLFRGLRSFGRWVESGELDVLLCHPTHPVTRISLSQVDPAALLSGLYSLPILFMAWRQSPPESAYGLVGCVFFLGIGVLIRRSLTLTAGLASLRLVRADAIHHLVDGMMPFARYPLGSFARGPWLIFKYVLPVALLANVPLLILFGELPTPLAIYPVAFLVAVNLINGRLWRLGARHYASGGG